MFKKIGYFFFLLTFSLFAVLPLFVNGLPNTHDGQTHVMRLASFHQALFDGQFPPRWAGNFAFGYGSPVVSYAFHLPYIMGEIFYLLGFSFIDATKTVFVVSYVFSGIFMFLFLRQIVGRFPAFVGAVIYQFAPFRFVDLYVRGDVGEALVFMFPPAILWLIYQSKKINILKVVFGSFLVGGMFLSHQIMASVFSGIILFLTPEKKRLPFTVLVLLLGFLLASYSLLPSIFEKKYTNLDHLIATNYPNQFPHFRSVIYSAWHWGPADVDNPEIAMSFQLGIAQWISVGILGILLFLLFLKEKAKFIFKNILIFKVAILFGVFLFFIDRLSKPLWDNFPLLPPLLYPWRLLCPQVFLVAVMSGVAISLIKRKWLKIIIAVILIIIALYGNRNHLQVNGRTIHDDNFYLTFPGTSDMWGEFLPKGVIPPEKGFKEKVEFIDGEGELKNLKYQSNKIGFDLKTNKDSQILVNNYFYPGWKVFVDGKEKEIIKNEKLIKFAVGKGDYEVLVIFKETSFRKFSNILSLITFLILSYLLAINSLFVIKGKIKR